MQDTLIFVQSIAQNFAMMCCALYAGAATYVGLVERPAILRSGVYVASAYMLFAQPRPTVYLTAFAGLGGITGMAAAILSSNMWELLGGLILIFAAAFNIVMVAPKSRGLKIPQEDDVDSQTATTTQLEEISRLYALQSIAGLAALLIYVIKT